MVGTGGTRNHPVYVENLVDLLELASTAPQARGRTYLAGDDQPVTLTQLVREVGVALGTRVRIVRLPFYTAAWLASAAIERAFKLVGRTPPVFRRRLSWFITNRHFRIDRARAELGYRPRISLGEGLARTAAWYRASGHLPPALALPEPPAERRRAPAGERQEARAPERRLAGQGRPAPRAR
jgi:2-alkyl-3-oxoalkanoate reductase